MDYSELISAAIGARRNSYAPYSRYRVGAALLCEDGQIVCGSNIENASYGGTVCAERVAVFSAVALGKRGFRALAVAGGPDDEEDELSSFAHPCGMCRQVLREFADTAELTIIVAKSESDFEQYTLEQLLPESFGPDNLKK